MFVLASLKTYKFLLDTQAALTNLTSGIAELNSTGVVQIEQLANQIQPLLVELEDTIDKFGADFSAQQIANQTNEYVFSPVLNPIGFFLSPDNGKIVSRIYCR